MRDAKSDEPKPGHFDSELEDYPGYFELPHPFLDRHMQLWWKHAIEPLKGLSRLDFEFYDAEWLAAVKLITEYGTWAVKAVPTGDLSSDSVPSAVKAWVMQKTSEYIYPFLPPKMLLATLGTTATG
jgi:hypothetical protein